MNAKTVVISQPMQQTEIPFELEDAEVEELLDEGPRLSLSGQDQLEPARSEFSRIFEDAINRRD